MNSSYIVMQGTSLVAATAVIEAPHTVTFSDGVQTSYAFDYRKAYSSGKIAFATGVAGVVTVTPTNVAATVTNSFALSQYRPDIGQGWVTRIISTTPAAGTTPTATTVCTSWKAAINAYITAGTFVGTVSSGATLSFQGTQALPLVVVSIILNGTVSPTTGIAASTAPVGTNTQLIASGIPASALSDTSYDTYIFKTPEVAAPEEGELEVGWRMLTVYVGKNATDYTNITEAILDVDVAEDTALLVSLATT